MITGRRAPLDERNVPTSVICSGSAWTPSAMPSRCTGRVRAAVTRSPNAGRTGLKQVNVPAVATASTIGVASLHALSDSRGRCIWRLTLDNYALVDGLLSQRALIATLP
jgi:hypothetical protein